jgi:hypothetical protein
MATELRKTILEYEDLQEQIVTVPEWGDTKILVRGMSSGARAKLLERASDPGGKVNMSNWFSDLVIATSFDPDTQEPIFDPADRDALKAKNGAAVNRITDVASKLSGLSDTAVEDAKARFGEAQNSEPDTN